MCVCESASLFMAFFLFFGYSSERCLSSKWYVEARRSADSQWMNENVLNELFNFVLFRWMRHPAMTQGFTVAYGMMDGGAWGSCPLEKGLLESRLKKIKADSVEWKRLRDTVAHFASMVATPPLAVSTLTLSLISSQIFSLFRVRR